MLVFNLSCNLSLKISKTYSAILTSQFWFHYINNQSMWVNVNTLTFGDSRERKEVLRASQPHIQ